MKSRASVYISIHRNKFCKFNFLLCVFLLWPFAVSSETEKNSEISSEEIKELVASVKNATQNFQLQLQQSHDNFTKTLYPGKSTEISLDLSVRGINESVDVYALLLMTNQKRILVERISKEVISSKSKIRWLNINFGRLNYNGLGALSNKAGKEIMKVGYAEVKSMAMDMAGNVGTGMISVLKVPAQNYPIHLSLPFETFSQLLESLTKQKMDEALMKKFRMDNEKFPVTVNLVYLATVQRGVNETIKNIRVKITPPKSIFFYDGVVLAPALVKRFSNGITVVRYDDSRVNRLFIKSRSPAGTKRPKLKEISKKTSQLKVNGKLDISVASSSGIQIGRISTVDFTVRYEKLKPASEIYVMLQPSDGDKVIQLDKGTKVVSQYDGVRLRLCHDPQLGSGYMRIQEDPIIINAPLFIGRMEAGHIASIDRGGAGMVSGRVTFTAPPLNLYYDRIRATPIALSWSDDGRLCTVMDTKKSPHIDIKIKDR